MWSRFDYSRKLVGYVLISMAFIMAIKYQFSYIICLGFILISEHYFIWDRWDFYDYLIGHEWWGLYLMTVGLIITGSYFIILPVVCGFLLGATYNKSNPFKLIIPTIKEAIC